MPAISPSIAAAIKSQLACLNQPETTTLRDNIRRVPHTISSLLPPHPKYKPHPQASDSPVRLVLHPQLHTYAYPFLVHPTQLSINGLSGSDQSSIFISPSSLFFATPRHTHTHILYNHAVPGLCLHRGLQHHGILPERSHRPACLCDDAHVATRPTFDVRLTRHTIVSRRKVEPSQHEERFQGVREEAAVMAATEDDAWKDRDDGFTGHD
jgi:hypothetical protein